eukprot:gb/GECG01012891.1/.p1 GENE.gb/GECG01012891.1/~~gb/GECG01012891.1/.p1  ORF type:complete len:621 (+),score=84.35 gb/GECG01012891.1/:1-1863(+)
MNERLQSARRFVQTTLSPESLEPDVESPTENYHEIWRRHPRSRYSFEAWDEGEEDDEEITTTSSEGPWTAHSIRKQRQRELQRSGMTENDLIWGIGRGQQTAEPRQRTPATEAHLRSTSSASRQAPSQPPTSLTDSKGYASWMARSQHRSRGGGYATHIDGTQDASGHPHFEEPGTHSPAASSQQLEQTPAEEWSSQEHVSASSLLKEMRESATAQFSASQRLGENGSASKASTSDQHRTGDGSVTKRSTNSANFSKFNNTKQRQSREPHAVAATTEGVGATQNYPGANERIENGERVATRQNPNQSKSAEADHEVPVPDRNLSGSKDQSQQHARVDRLRKEGDAGYTESHIRSAATPAFVIDPSPHYETYNTRKTTKKPTPIALDKEITEEFCAANPVIMYKKYRELMRAAESLYCQLQEKDRDCARPRGARHQINMDKGLYKQRYDLPREEDTKRRPPIASQHRTAKLFSELDDPQVPEDYSPKPPPTDNERTGPRFLTQSRKDRKYGEQGRLATIEHTKLVDVAQKNPRETAPVYGQVLEELCEELGASNIEELRVNARKSVNVCWQHSTYKQYADTVCDLMGEYLAKLNDSERNGEIPHVGLEESLTILDELLGRS